MYTVCKFIAKCIHAKYVHALIYILSRGKRRTEKLPRERGHAVDKKANLRASILRWEKISPSPENAVEVRSHRVGALSVRCRTGNTGWRTRGINRTCAVSGSLWSSDQRKLYTRNRERRMQQKQWVCNGGRKYLYLSTISYACGENWHHAQK